MYSPQDASFHPICGHFFWNNNHGATAVCVALGFGYGVSVRTNAAYNRDAMPVGECHAGEALDICSAGGNAFGDLSYNGGSCRSGNSIGVEIICTIDNNGGVGTQCAHVPAVVCSHSPPTYTLSACSLITCFFFALPPSFFTPCYHRFH